MSNVYKPVDKDSTAEAYAAVAATFTEALTNLARLIVASDCPTDVKEGAAKAYEATYKRMVMELDPDLGELRGQTKH
jgi:hypothetical protein